MQSRRPLHNSRCLVEPDSSDFEVEVMVLNQKDLSGPEPTFETYFSALILEYPVPQLRLLDLYLVAFLSPKISELSFHNSGLLFSCRLLNYKVPFNQAAWMPSK